MLLLKMDQSNQLMRNNEKKKRFPRIVELEKVEKYGRRKKAIGMSKMTAMRKKNEILKSSVKK